MRRSYPLTAVGSFWLQAIFAGRNPAPIVPRSSEQASNEMRALTTDSYVKRTLDVLSKPQTDHFGKIGIGTDGTYHDLAVVERATSKGRIRYGSIMLGSLGFRRRIPQLALELDRLVESLH